jgi:hypothetical protein
MAVRKKPRRFGWARYSDDRLMDVRLCDLKVTLDKTVLVDRIERIYEELDNRDIMCRPYFWLSDEWFTPSGMTGTAIPYLTHRRLMRLERSQMGEVEGGSHEWCMKLLRHEVGHVIDHAYRLNRRKKRWKLFGHSSMRYPRMYRPNPYSRRHVQHLSYWYAQSHPDEDFAETFAVWLRPRHIWRKKYRGWPALKKLEYMDELMSDIADMKPLVLSRACPDSLSTLKKTLRQHYANKRGGIVDMWPDQYDRDLQHLFTKSNKRKKEESASAFIRRIRPEILRMLSPWIGDRRYQIDHVLTEMMGRCRELKLYASGPPNKLKRDLAIVLTKHTIDSLFRRRRSVEM